MSSSSSTVAHRSILQAHHVANLAAILRNANSRYQLIADDMRRCITFTHHARKRAEGLRLAVDVVKARNCPHRVVAVEPLPILDTTISPTQVEAPPRPPLRRRKALKCVIPPIVIPAPGSERRLQSNQELLSALSPQLMQLAPCVLRDSDNPWRGPSSRFSITPNDVREISEIIPMIHISPEGERKTDFPPAPAPGLRSLPDVPIDETERYWIDLDFSTSPFSMSTESSSSSSGLMTPVSADLHLSDICSPFDHSG